MGAGQRNPQLKKNSQDDPQAEYLPGLRPLPDSCSNGLGKADPEWHPESANEDSLLGIDRHLRVETASLISALHFGSTKGIVAILHMTSILPSKYHSTIVRPLTFRPESLKHL